MSDECPEQSICLAAIFEANPDPIVIARLQDQLILAVNEAWVLWSGHPRESALGRTVSELRLWPSEGERSAFFAALQTQGHLSNRLTSLRRADGGVRQLLLSATLVEATGATGVVLFGSDVTAQRAVEQALAESETRYQSLFQAASDCLLIIDPEGRLIDINDQGARTFGYTREELLGDSFVRVLGDQSLEHLYPRTSSLELKRHAVRGEYELRSRSGGLHHVEMVASPMPDGNVLAIVRDITERKRMEQLLANVVRGVSAELGERFFKSMVAHLCTNLEADYALLGEIVAPDNTRVRTLAFIADGTAQENFEYALKGSPGAEVLERRGTVAYPKRAADVFPQDAQLRRLGVEAYVGTSVCGVDGAPLGILVVMSRRPIEKVKLWSSILEIFASRAAAEMERSRAEARVRELNLSLEHKVFERTKELEAANRELDSFSHSVSHDLTAPLRRIAGFATLLRSQHAATLAGEPMLYLEAIERGVLLMDQLIQALLELSRTSRSPLGQVPTRMLPIVDGVIEDLRQYWGPSANLRVGDLPDALCDHRLIRQVWQNLIGNALKFSSRNPEPVVEIGARRIDEQIEYWVKDNGAGFDMARADRLFGAFQRLHSASEFEGTGIGLAIVRQVVERHGGTVKAESQPGRGTTITFTLPATASTAPEELR